MALDTMLISKATAPMPPKPVRQYSFTNWQVNNPTAPPPGDKMDSEYDQSNGSIGGVIDWASVSLNTDGTLRDGSVDESTLQPGLFDSVASDAISQVQPYVDQAGSYAGSAASSASGASASATQAQTQATVASGAATTATQASAAAQASANNANTAANTAGAAASNAQTSANNAQGAEASAQDWGTVSQAWAEHMPDTIPPNILAIMGITGDHWSSRWWANEASIAVQDALQEVNDAIQAGLDEISQAGAALIATMKAMGDSYLAQMQGLLAQAQASFAAYSKTTIQQVQKFYLGAYASPPTADSFGSPIAVGASYYNLVLAAPYVWDGNQWAPFSKPSPVDVFRYIYVATAGQTVFTGGDRDGNILKYDPASFQTLNVWDKGLLLTPTDNYTATSNSVTLKTPAAVGDIVQMEVVAAPSVNLEWRTVKLDTSGWTPTSGNLIDHATGNPVNPAASSDVFISANGIWLSADLDYTLGSSVVNFVTPLEPDALTFGICIVPVTIQEGTPIPAVTKLDTRPWVFNGVQVTFSLVDYNANPVLPQTDANAMISLNGVWLEATKDYTVSGSMVTFTTAPEADALAFGIAGLPAFMS